MPFIGYFYCNLLKFIINKLTAGWRSGIFGIVVFSESCFVHAVGDPWRNVIWFFENGEIWENWFQIIQYLWFPHNSLLAHKETWDVARWFLEKSSCLHCRCGTYIYVVFCVSYFFLGFDQSLAAYIGSDKTLESRARFLAERNHIRDTTLLLSGRTVSRSGRESGGCDRSLGFLSWSDLCMVCFVSRSWYRSVADAQGQRAGTRIQRHSAEEALRNRFTLVMRPAFGPTIMVVPLGHLLATRRLSRQRVHALVSMWFRQSAPKENSVSWHSMEKWMQRSLSTSLDGWCTKHHARFFWYWMAIRYISPKRSRNMWLQHKVSLEYSSLDYFVIRIWHILAHESL